MRLYPKRISPFLAMIILGCDNNVAKMNDVPSEEPEFDSLLVIYQGETDSSELNELVIQSTTTFAGVPRIESSPRNVTNSACDSSKKMACIHFEYPQRNNGHIARIAGDPTRIYSAFGSISTWANDCGQHFVYAYFGEKTRVDLMSQSELDKNIQKIELDTLSLKLYKEYIDSTSVYYKNKPYYCI